VTDSLHRRARQVQSRATIRAWEYRQRRHAKGVWFRLRRVLADAREAFLVSEQEADRLVAEGYSPEPVGAELEPPKRIFFLPAARVASITGRAQVPIKLEGKLLDARALVLIRFPKRRVTRVV